MSPYSYAFNSEQRHGTLEKGKLADFIVLSHDPRAIDPVKIKDIKVLKNYIEGQLVYSLP
ncbi:amidohydrolase family protein [Paraglaciecola aestuariivivens]